MLDRPNFLSLKNSNHNIVSGLWGRGNNTFKLDWLDLAENVLRAEAVPLRSQLGHQMGRLGPLWKVCRLPQCAAVLPGVHIKRMQGARYSDRISGRDSGVAATVFTAKSRGFPGPLPAVPETTSGDIVFGRGILYDFWPSGVIGPAVDALIEAMALAVGNLDSGLLTTGAAETSDALAGGIDVPTGRGGLTRNDDGYTMNSRGQW